MPARLSSSWATDVAGDRRPGGWMVPVGAVLFLLGIVFWMQGMGVLGGSPMSDTLTWTVLGPLVAMLGLGLAVRGIRRR